MPTIDELEARLADTLDAGTLAVYADALQLRDDPRGELIAIDLAADATGLTPALAARRRECLRAWLGTGVAGRRWNPARFRYGLFDDFGAPFQSVTNTAYISALFASPVMPYVRGLTLQPFEEEFGETLALVGARPRPWLRRLAIHNVRVNGDPFVLDDRFVAATPHLEVLRLRGTNCFRDIFHPALRRLELHEHPVALAELRHPNVTALAIDPMRYVIADLATPFPALRELDLSQSAEPAFDRLARLPDSITALRVSAPRTPADQVALVRLADARPELAITLANVHAMFADRLAPIDHARIVVLEASPFPPVDARGPRTDELLVFGPARTSRDDLVFLMAARFAELEPPARTAWRAIWAAVEALDRGELSIRLSASTVLDALDPIDDLRIVGGSGEIRSWRQLAEVVRARGDVVVIDRIV